MKKYWYIVSIVVFVCLIILITSKEIKDNFYKVGTEQVFTTSIDSTIIINKNKLTQFVTNPVIVSLSVQNNFVDSALQGFSVRYVNPENILSKENKEVYKKYEGLVILYSNDISLATQAWVILSKKGYKNIFILDLSGDEKFKHSFKSSL